MNGVVCIETMWVIGETLRLYLRKSEIIFLCQKQIWRISSKKINFNSTLKSAIIYLSVYLNMPVSFSFYDSTNFFFSFLFTVAAMLYRSTYFMGYNYRQSLIVPVWDLPLRWFFLFLRTQPLQVLDHTFETVQRIGHQHVFD